MLQENHTNKVKYVLVAYLSLYVIIKIIFIYSGHDLFSEESQYWLWSRHLDWSYYSKPPLIAWINFLTETLFGHSDHVIRFTALGFGLATIAVLYQVAIELFENIRVALIATIILSVSPYFILASTFFTTDTLLLFFWSLTFYLFLKGLKSKSLTIWLWVGVSFGLGCLSKYTMIFFILILLTPFFFLQIPSKSTYIKQLVAMCVMATIMNVPVMWWNYSHGWITIKHVNTLALGENNNFDLGQSLKYVGEFIGGVIVINSPFYFIMFLKGYLQNHKLFNHLVKQKIALLTFPVIGTILFFLALSISDPVEVNWPSMAYLTLPLAMAYFVISNGYWRLFVYSSTLTGVLLLLLLFPRVQDKVGLSQIIPIEFDSMMRMAGWRELSERVSQIKNVYNEDECVFILSPNYHIASAVSFYMNTDQVVCIEFNRRKNQFDLWKGINQYENTCCYGIYISDQIIPPSITQAFEYEIILENVPIHYRGHLVRNFNIYVLKNFSGWHNYSSSAY